MALVEIYTQPLCGYCWRAKRVLGAKAGAFTEVDLAAEPGRRAEMLARSGGRRTVPQIFIDGRHIGGCDDLMELEASGELGPLLAGQAGATSAA